MRGRMSVQRLILRMSRYRALLAGVPAFATIVALTVNLMLPARYTALARLLPPRTNTATAAAMLNQIGGTETLGASALTLKSPSDLYASLFLSRSVQDSIIARFRLTARYGETDMDALRQLLTGKTHVDVREDGIIELRYEDEDPQAAAAIVNGMIDAVYRKAQQLSRIEADNRLAFYDQIIAETRRRLADAESRLRTLETQTGYTRLKGQEEATSLTASDLESALLARETQLSRMLATATEAHPAVKRIRVEIGALREKMRALDGHATDGGADDPARRGGIVLPVGRFPDLQAQVEPARRDVEIQKEVLEYLSKARQLSRVDEKRDLSNVQVLDEAVPPTRKSGPRAIRNVILAAGISTLLSLLACLAWDVLIRQHRYRRRLLRMLRPYVARRTPHRRTRDAGSS